MTVSELSDLFESNRKWARAVRADDPHFFEKLSKQQAPKILWIGCSDSRVPANTVVGLMPGEIFVHRNVANIVVHSDLNCLSVLQFAVDVLHVRHVVVCGHYGCSGVHAALRRERIGLADNWLRHVRDVQTKHDVRLRVLVEAEQHARLCELNVIEQVARVCETSIVRDAWERNQKLSVHGWIYGIGDGILHDLHTTVRHHSETSARYDEAVAALGRRGAHAASPAV